MYIYGSVMDISFIPRAKNELFQLVVSALLLVLAVSIVEFMCSDIVAQMFNVQSSDSFTAAETYLERLSSYLERSFYAVGAISGGVKTLGSVEIETKSPTLYSQISKGASASVGFMDASISAFFLLILSSYLVTLTQIQIMKILPIMCLGFLFPIGLVVRCLFPFRRFGGALMGAAIAMYIMVPFILLVNQAMFGAFIAEPVFKSTACTSPSMCYSGMCVDSKCASLKDDFEPCESDSQCASSYCVLSGQAKKCNSCGILGDVNRDCCQGFVWDGAKCVIGKHYGESCSTQHECASWSCVSGKCASKMPVGSKCEISDQCVSRSCGGTAPNKECAQTIMTEKDKLYLLSLQLAYAQSGQDSEMFDIGVSPSAILATPPSDVIAEANQINSKSKIPIISDIYNLYRLAVGALLAGVLMPLLDVAIVSAAVRNLSAFFGDELDISSIWRIV
jgi:hypothetical protein